MTDEKRLSDALAKLAAPATDALKTVRELQALKPEGLVDAILGEIDETVLARKLTLRNQNGDSIELEVANRRLICLAGLSGDIAVPPHESLVGEVLSATRTDLVKQLLATFEAVIGDSTILSVTASASTGDFGPAHAGLPTTTLSEIWTEGTSSSAPDAQIINKFTSACLELATAEIRLHLGNVEFKRGEKEDVERLIEIAGSDGTDVQEKLDKCFSGQSNDARLIVTSGPAEHGAIVSVSAGEHLAFLMIPKDRRLESIAIWQGLTTAD